VSRRLNPNEAVVAAEVGEELVLLNVESGVYFGLDPIGTRVWQLLTEGADEDTLVARLLAEYEVTEEILRADLTVLFEQLVERGLVTNTNGQA
jgi:hypothetical protein